jgi:hypothetical protein
MDNMKMDLKEMGCEDVDLIHVAEDRHCYQAFVEYVMNFWGFCKKRQELLLSVYQLLKDSAPFIC